MIKKIKIKRIGTTIKKVIPMLKEKKKATKTAPMTTIGERSNNLKVMLTPLVTWLTSLPILLINEAVPTSSNS